MRNTLNVLTANAVSFLICARAQDFDEVSTRTETQVSPTASLSIENEKVWSAERQRGLLA